MQFERINKNIDTDRVHSEWSCNRGNYSWVVSNRKIIKEEFGLDIPKKMCLKIMKENPSTDLMRTPIGDTRDKNWCYLEQMIIAQNLVAMNGFAPRIHKLILAKSKDGSKEQILLLMDFINEPTNELGEIEELKNKLLSIATKYHIRPYQQEIEYWHNYRGGKFIDFHGFKINLQEYRDDLFESIRTITHFGKNINGEQISYQEAEEFPGKRKTNYRIQKFGKIDFNGKTVLDIGCNLGLFLHYAEDNGATKMLGVDKPRLIQVAKEYANLKHQWNIDFKDVDLNEEHDFGKYDIVFYLAMEEYFGIPKWLIDSVGEVLYFEGNASTNKENVRKELEKHFKVTDLGFTDDRSQRCLFKCEK